jgi:Domain of unknown function (DUF5122) beta-propeller
MKKVRKLLAMTAVLLVLIAAAVRGQSALDGFDPNRNGTVNVVVQPDGKILIGGTFNTVLGVARNRIARLNPDGTLDTAFNPNANDSVVSIAVQTFLGTPLYAISRSDWSLESGQVRKHARRSRAH